MPVLFVFLPMAHLLISDPVLHMSGLDHRGLGVRRFPGDGLLFVLFQEYHLIDSICGRPCGNTKNLAPAGLAIQRKPQRGKL